MDNIELNNTLIEPQNQSNISAEHFKMLSESLLESHKWMNRMIIITMVSLAVLLLISLMLVLTVGQNFPGATTVVTAIFFLAIMIPAFFIFSLLFKHSKNLKMFGESKNSEYLVASFAYYKKYWVAQGIVLAVAVSLYSLLMLLRFIA